MYFLPIDTLTLKLLAVWLLPCPPVACSILDKRSGRCGPRNIIIRSHFVSLLAFFFSFFFFLFRTTDEVAYQHINFSQAFYSLVEPLRRYAAHAGKQSYCNLFVYVYECVCVWLYVHLIFTFIAPKVYRLIWCIHCVVLYRTCPCRLARGGDGGWGGGGYVTLPKRFDRSLKLVAQPHT